MSTEFAVQMNHEQRRVVVGGEPMILLGHHVTHYLQQVIRDAAYLDSGPILVGAGEEVAHAQLKELFAAVSVDDVVTRKRMAGELFRWAGFGRLDLSPLSEEGGAVCTHHEYYGQTRLDAFGRSGEPVAFFAAGWLAGALAAVYGLPGGSFRVEQRRCMGMDPEGGSEFVLRKCAPAGRAHSSVGVGVLHKHRMRHIPPGNVDYEGVAEAIGRLPLEGNDEGRIPAFGKTFARHYANYCNRIVFETERAGVEQFGASFLDVAEPMFVESGQVCAFHTFGGIMKSSEWGSLIQPALKSAEDWVHGIVAVINTLGWGRWQVAELGEGGAEFVIQDDYESVGHLAMYGKADHNVSYLAKGAVVGIMNLVYYGGIQNKPVLDQDFYSRLFKSRGGYRAETLSCLAMGDEATIFRVSPKAR